LKHQWAAALSSLLSFSWAALAEINNKLMFTHWRLKVCCLYSIFHFLGVIQLLAVVTVHPVGQASFVTLLVKLELMVKTVLRGAAAKTMPLVITSQVSFNPIYPTVKKTVWAAILF
jgi:hypothetical protein